MIDELIARLEAATGPDRELDAEILVATQRLYSACHKPTKCATCNYRCRRKGIKEAWPSYNGGGPMFWVRFKDGSGGGTDDIPFTGSIDAALTLVPSTMNAAIDTRKPAAATLGGEWVYAATPALAIVIAALRAIEARQQ